MYIYTDDDLTRINRDYLGPKGKRLPWVATYRTYVVVGAVVTGIFAVFMFVGMPLNQWTVLLFLVLCFLASSYAIRRMNRDVSLLAMFQAGWQEVNVPRANNDGPKSHQVKASVQRFDYDATPEPYWWQKARAAIAAKFRKPAKAAGDKTKKKAKAKQPKARPAASNTKQADGTAQRARRRKS